MKRIWPLLALKMEGATGQGIEAASKNWEKQGNSPGTFQKEPALLALAHET